MTSLAATIRRIVVQTLMQLIAIIGGLLLDLNAINTTAAKTSELKQ
jgi:hypothetical protein